MADEPTLNIVIGSTNYSLPLVPGEPIVTVKKPDSGEIQKTVAILRRGDQLDAPWSMTGWSGLGVSRAVEVMPDADNRLWELRNMMVWPGMMCLGPLARTVTDVTGTRRTIGFFQFRNNLFMYADTTGSGTTESIQTWATSGTLGDATAVSDFNATAGAGSGFNCVGMCDQDGRAYALRATRVGTQYQLIYSTNGTTWTVVDHVNAADCPDAGGSNANVGLISIVGVMYTAVLNSSNQILLRRNAASNNGVTWTTLATSTESVTSITSVIAYKDYTSTLRPVVLTPEGAFIYDGTTFYKFISHSGLLGFNSSNTGQRATVWDVEGVEDGYLGYPIGKNILLFNWGDNNGERKYLLGPAYKTQGLPLFRDGLVTALASSPDFLFAAIGGDSSSTTGGIYMRSPQYLHPLGWFGPFYSVAASNRQVRAMIVSNYNDNVVRLLISVDNGTSNDTDILYFDNITSDPRTIDDYLHTASVGTVIFPKNDRGLPELNKIWRSVEIVGTNIDTTDKITDIFASADAAPLSSNDSWGTTLGEITANAGTANFAGTPSGTGLSARAVQLRIDLEGGANDSSYIEGINVYVKSLLPVKYIRRFPVWARAQGSIRPLQVVLNDLEAIVEATTDLNVTFGEETTAIVMEPYRLGNGPISYEYETESTGTVNDQIRDITKVFLTLVQV